MVPWGGSPSQSSGLLPVEKEAVFKRSWQEQIFKWELFLFQVEVFESRPQDGGPCESTEFK